MKVVKCKKCGNDLSRFCACYSAHWLFEGKSHIDISVQPKPSLDKYDEISPWLGHEYLNNKNNKQENKNEQTRI